MGELFDKGGMLPPGTPVLNTTGKPIMVGRIGSTGKSTGPHLHFENVRVFRSACARCGSIIAVHVCGENWAE